MENELFNKFRKDGMMYYIIGTEKQFEDMQELLSRVLSNSALDSLHDKVAVLDSYYGNTRDLQKDLGGLCIVLPTIDDWAESCHTVFEKYHIEKELYEYRKEYTVENPCWIEELYMISSDYGIILFYPQNDKMKGGAGEQ